MSTLAQRLMASYQDLLGESRQYDGDFNTELFEYALDTATGLLDVAEPSTLEFLAAWNEAYSAATDVEFAVTVAQDPYPFEVAEEFTRSSAFLRRGVEHYPEGRALLVAQALWHEVGGGWSNEVGRQEELRREHLEDPLLAGTLAAAQVLLRTPLVLARVAPLREPLLHGLLRSLAIAPGSLVLLAPRDAVALVDHASTGIEVGAVTPQVHARLEALAALLTDGGADLAELWEATEEL